MGGIATRQRKRKITREVARRRRNLRSYEFMGHVQEESYNERYIGLHEDQRNAKHEEELSSDDEESRSWKIAEEVKFYDPGDATLTFVEEEDVLDFEYDDFKSLRALMSCGHAVTPTSLTNWYRYLLRKGDCTFECGATDCDAEWPFNEVCKMALLTPEEIEDFEKKLFENAARDFLDVKCCPGCKSRVMRTDVRNLRVLCTVCTIDNNRPYTFCWQCLKRWKGPDPRSDRCANDECQNPLEILKSCPPITFEDVEGVTGCPSVRACPTCGLLVVHDTTECKNIHCARCKVEFCFVCLKLTKDCVDEANIITFFNLCSGGVAPRQTTMPVWRRM